MLGPLGGYIKPAPPEDEEEEEEEDDDDDEDVEDGLIRELHQHRCCLDWLHVLLA